MAKEYINGVFLNTEECKYNQRKKLYIDKNGVLLGTETMVSTSQLFSDKGNELSDLSKDRIRREKWNKDLDEMYGFSGNYQQKGIKENPLDRSKRRAKKQIKDFILCGNFDCFVTLTLDKEKISRTDYNEVIKKMNTFLGHKVQRNGLRYLGVAELHKNGGIHFHFLMNKGSLNLCDSGTVSVPDHKKPIKVSTADRYKIAESDRHKVYNLCDWGFGFSTAIDCYGSLMSVANYICKYITKADEKIGGRWYYSGGSLVKPVVQYSNSDYDKALNYDWEYDCGYGTIKCKMECMENED